MKALTIWQPWASLIMMGAKPYEFRGWKPPRSLIGQRLAIHAGARPVRAREVKDLIRVMRWKDGPTPCLHADIAMPILERVEAALTKSPDKTLFGTSEGLMLPLSCILGSVLVGEPKPGHECAAEFGEDAGNDSDREGTFNWGWPMLDIKPQPPTPAKGAQGLWDWSR